MMLIHYPEKDDHDGGLAGFRMFIAMSAKPSRFLLIGEN